MERLLTPLRALLLGGFVLISVYVLISRLSAARARKILIHQHGCGAIPTRRFRDPFFALDGILEAVGHVKSHTFLDFNRQQYQQHGNTFASQIGPQKTIGTTEPENFKAILSTHFKDYEVGSPRRNAFGPALGNSILLVDGAAWEHSRALLRPSFNRNQISDLEVIEAHVQALVNAIPKDGTTVDLQALFHLFTADVTTDFLFGESIQSLSKPHAFGGDLAEAFRNAQTGAEKRFRFGMLANLVPNAPFYAAIKKIHAYMDAHVDKAVKSRESQKQQQDNNDEKSLNDDKPKKYIFLHELAKATSDRETLRNELSGIFVAGRDTTAALLSNLFFVLARNPRISQRLREEVAQLSNEKPTVDDLKGMSYLTACINESLRLYPVVQGASRIAIKDTILPRGGGPDGTAPVLVPQGTLAIYHYFVMHQRRDIWGDDAREFRPERWEERKRKAVDGGGGTAWDFLPFGGGPRNCIGQQFALLEASYAVVRLLQCFGRVESRDERPWTESIGATVSSANGVLVAMFD